MRCKRSLMKVSLLAAAMLVAGTVVGIPVGAQGGDEKPQAGEIGVTADEIRVAVVADVENPLSPGQFQSQVDAMQAYAEFANDNGGIAGRELVIDFIDSRLNADEARNATIKACAEDLAMVGTAVVFMNNVDDMEGCVDAEGTATGLPDIATLQSELAHQCSTVTYSISPPQLDCSTKDDAEKTYRAALGQIRYYLSQNKDLHGICVGPADLKSTEIVGRVHCTAIGQFGITLDGEGFYPASARAPQSALTPIVAAAKAEGVTYFYTLAGYQQVVSIRKEAKLQGLNTVEVWDCSRSCYSDEFLETGGADVEDNYSFLNTLPLDETKQNKALRTYIKYVGKDKADAFGETGWVAGMLFHQVIDEIVDEHGINGITRARMLERLAATKDFDAGGMLAKTDVGERVPSPCFNLQQVQGGKFVRVHPEKKGTFDCNPKNVEIVKLAD